MKQKKSYVGPAIKRKPIDTAEILSDSKPTMGTGKDLQTEPAAANLGLWDNDNESEEEAHSTIWQ